MMAELPVVKIGSVLVDGVQPFFVLGPCVIESEAFVWDMARRLKAIADPLGFALDFQGIL